MTRRLLPVAAALLLLTACGGDQEPTEETTPPSSPSRSVPAPATTPATTTEGQAQLTQQVATIYQTVAAQHPPVNFDLCGPATPLGDQACGTTLTASAAVATGVAQQLATLDTDRFAAVTAAANQVLGGLRQAVQSIPCYGLSDAPPPPPELTAEAQGICADGANIAATEWGLFLSQLELASGFRPA